MILRIITPVWGFDYIDFFVRYSLPSLVADGVENDLGGSANTIELHIYTTVASLDQIQRSVKLQGLVTKTGFRLCLHIIEANAAATYEAMTWAHQHAVSAIDNRSQALFFSNPDVIYAEGALRKTFELAAQGKKAVMVLGLRADKELLLSALAASAITSDSGQSMRISNRDLVALCLKHLHPLSQAHIVAKKRNFSLGHYYWPLDNKALLARCFHIHPLFLWPDYPGKKIITTIDHELVRWSLADLNSVHVVQDSDELFLCELSSSKHQSGMISKNPISIDAFVEWAAEWTNELHRSFARRSIIFRSENVEIPPEIEQQATDLVSSYLGALSVSFGGKVSPDMLVVWRSLNPHKVRCFPVFGSVKRWIVGLAEKCGPWLTYIVATETLNNRQKLTTSLQRLDSTTTCLSRIIAK